VTTRKENFSTWWWWWWWRWWCAQKETVETGTRTNTSLNRPHWHSPIQMCQLLVENGSGFRLGDNPTVARAWSS
jgi:hypothetical protein